jgi:hypothetical protein
MMFTPQSQLQNMLSAAASQVMCGHNMAENTAKLIALQAQMDMQQQHSHRKGPVNLFDEWF